MRSFRRESRNTTHGFVPISNYTDMPSYYTDSGDTTVSSSLGDRADMTSGRLGGSDFGSNAELGTMGVLYGSGRTLW